MKLKKLALKILVVIAILILLVIITPFIVFRLPEGSAKQFQREVRYQYLDFGQNGGERWYFEKGLNNRRLFLAPEDTFPKWIYVSEQDYKKCWYYPHSMMVHDTFTFVITFQASPLLLIKDVSFAKITEIEKIKKFPITSK